MADRLLYLSRSDVASLGLNMADIIPALERMFREKGDGRVEMPPKPGIHPRQNSFIHAMPGYIPKLGAAGMKWVSGFPENAQKGLPYISGLIILNSPETGLPLAIMDCTWITAKRTGAATALAAKFLARPDSETVGILGCGVQGKSNLEALRALFPLRRVMAYDVKPEAARRYVGEMSSELGLEIIPVGTPEEAVTGCDLVVTAGPILKIPHATIKPGWLSKGAFASLVDFDSYWDPGAFSEVDKFCTDDSPQLEYYQTVGYFQHIPPVYADLGEIVTGRKPGRESPRERNMACNLGLALEDLATALLLYELAIKKGAGTWLPL
jgi:ornithine cyclodeaminase/alanine dehydrogenase-like protein (mu-crystallin family)